MPPVSGDGNVILETPPPVAYAPAVRFDFESARVWTADNGTGSHPAEGGVVYSVTDLSGNDEFLRQATAGSKPLWRASVLGMSKPGIQSVSADFMATNAITIADGASLTFYAVLKPSAFASNPETVCGFISDASPTLTMGGFQRTAAKTWQIKGRNGSANIVANALLTVANDTDPLLLIGVIEAGVGLRLWSGFVGNTPFTTLAATTADAGTTSGLTTNPEPFCVMSRASTAAATMPTLSTVHECGVFPFALSPAQIESLSSQLFAAHFIGGGLGPGANTLTEGLQYQYLMDETSGTRYNSGSLGSGVAPLAENTPGAVGAYSVAGVRAAVLVEAVGTLSVTSDAFNYSGSFTETIWFNTDDTSDTTWLFQYKAGSTVKCTAYYGVAADPELIWDVIRADTTTSVPVASGYDVERDEWVFAVFAWDAAAGVAYVAAASEGGTITAFASAACPDICDAPGGVFTILPTDKNFGTVLVTKRRSYNRVLTLTEVALRLAEGPA